MSAIEIARPIRGALCLLALLLLGLGSPADAAQRVALVMGNGAYQHATPLKNPPNDAHDMAMILEHLGFEVIESLDVDIAAMRDSLQKFSGQARGAEAALFFYAGHGLQVDGKNYLLPVSTELKDRLDLSFEAVSLDLILGIMEQAVAKVRLAIVDACRNNAFSSLGGRSLGAGRGLARAEIGSAGTLIAFATAPGEIAADGDQRNSPFTAALKQHIETPGLEIRALFGRVRETVLASTGERQLPWVNEAISGEFFLVPPAAEEKGEAQSRPAADTEALQLAFWESIQDSGDWRDFQAYLDQFGESSVFGSLARLRRDRLRDEDASGTDSADEAQVAQSEPAPPEQLAALPPADEPVTEARPEPEPPDPLAALKLQEASLGRATRREIQTALGTLGLYSGAVDGLFGPVTRSAVKAYQARIAAPGTGYLEPDQLARLRADAASALERRTAEAQAEAAAATQTAAVTVLPDEPAAPKAVDLEVSWSPHNVTSQGSGTMTGTLRIEGTRISGEIDQYGRRLQVSGSLTDGRLSLDFRFDLGVQWDERTFAVEGELDGGKLAASTLTNTYHGWAVWKMDVSATVE